MRSISTLLTLSQHRSSRCLILVAMVIAAGCSSVRHDAAALQAAPHEHTIKPYTSAAFGPDGRLWRLRLSDAYALVDVSSDLGRSFAAPVRVNSAPMEIKAKPEDNPQIVVDPRGRVFVSFAAFGDTPYMAYYSVSSDGGAHFSSPVPLSDHSREAKYYQAALTVSPAGETYAYWHDDRAATREGNAIYRGSLSAAAGAIPHNEFVVDHQCECCRLAVDFDAKGRPVLFARAIYAGNIRDHGFVRWNGSAWETWRVTDDEWQIEACPEHGPALSIDEADGYHIAWFSLGSRRKGLFYAQSVDGGRHFSRPMSLGDPAKLPGHPDVLAAGGRVVLAWTDFDGSRTRLMVMVSRDSGQTWSPATAMATTGGTADYPRLLKRGQELFVSWNSDAEGYRLIALP